MASPGARLVAFVVDVVLINVIGLGVLFLAAIYFPEKAAAGVLAFLIFMLPAFYFVGFWVNVASTPGKMLFGLHIVDASTGHRVSVRQSLMRYIGFFTCALPAGLGFLTVLLDSNRQGLHDKMGRTLVAK